MTAQKVLIGVVLSAVALIAGCCGGEASSDAGADESPVALQGLPTGSERVELDPADFTTRIDNPYRPMSPGDRSVFRVTDAEGLRERAVVTVTDRTKLIANGVRARVVYTEVTEAGTEIEDNHAWYAQDDQGSVWYLGELAREFEKGRVKTTKGSWESGVDDAQPGVVMPAHPEVGVAFREEYAAGVAEDQAEVFSLDERAGVPFGRFRSGVLLIKERSPLDPPAFLDYKFYAEGVGPVLGIEVSGGSGREELVSFRH